MPPAVAWLILFGEQHQHRMVELDKGRVELMAAKLRGIIVPLIPGVCDAGHACRHLVEIAAIYRREPQAPV